MKSVTLLVCGLALLACTAPPPPQPEAPPPTPAAAENPESWRAEIPRAGATSPPEFPTPEVRKLDNGLAVYSLRRRAGTTSILLLVRAGSSGAPEGKSGLAALTTRMLTEGTIRHPGLALAEAVESMGATLGHDTARDHAEVYLEVLPNDLDSALALLAEVVVEPAFRRDDFQRVRKQWLDRLRAERQDPHSLASLVGLRTLLGPRRGAPISGSIPDVESLSLADLRTFHRSAYVPANAALVVVGDVPADTITRSARAAFGKWQGRRRKPASPAASAEPTASSRIVVVDRPDAQQTTFFVGQPFPHRATPGHEVREVLNGIIGGLFTSRLNQNLREKHAYTYGARSVAVATHQWGAFVVLTSVETQVTKPALEQLLAELRETRNAKLGRPITEQEVGRAKADLVQSVGASLEHTDSVADVLGNLFVHRLPADYPTTYPKVVSAISQTRVAAEAEDRLTPDRLTIVAVGDSKRIHAELSKLGIPVSNATPASLE